MGNQLAATPTVDLANVSSDLELIAPLGAEGRNYFATFHCLYYTPLSSSTSAGATGLRAAPTPFISSDNAPGFTTDFFAVDDAGRRAEYHPNGLYYPSSSHSNTAGSPLRSGSPTRATLRGRGRGGGMSALSSTTSANTVTAVTTARTAARERAVWHQARWRQRLPVAARPWRVIPAMFVSEATQERCPAGEAMDRWCRDSTSASAAFSHSSAGRSDSYVAEGTAISSPLGSAPSSMTGRAAPMMGAATSATDMDATVAGVVGEWRGNYGNYVQLLLRGGSSARHTLTSAALCDGQVIQVAADPTAAAAGGGGYGARNAFTAAMSITMPSAHGANPSTSPPVSSFVMHDVVTKVFVRTQDDPGQTYFLKRVQQMMGNAGEQLSVIDSTLTSTTPRNCLWYSLVYEGDGFCVLQRPYVAFTLRERLTARPGFTAQEKLFVSFQLLQAVAHLHETYGLTHGDIKPNNVLVQSTGVVVLCDMAPFKPWRLPLDSPLLFDYYYDTDESRACYVAPEKFSDQPLPTPPLESKTPGNATYNVENVNFASHTAAMDVFSAACVVLFLYAEEDPFTLSEVLSLRHLSTTEARERAITPVLHECDVPPALHPLLRWMLCSASAKRPSAREVLKRGLAERVFPACFEFLYVDVWPRLLTQSPDVRLRLLQNQLQTVLQRCAELDAPADEVAVEASQGEGKETTDALHAPDAASNASRAAAVSILLPLLLQTMHSTATSDEASFRGLSCLRQCVSYCSFDALTDVVLPHLVYLVNDDAHVYGAPTRLLAIRLLCTVSETIARHLTSAQSVLLSAAAAAASSSGDSSAEEQWALLEHLVLPCLYDVLRQAEEESTAVLVELAERLPRLLLLTRFLTERRQVLYGAEDVAASPTTVPVPMKDGGVTLGGAAGDASEEAKRALQKERDATRPLSPQLSGIMEAHEEGAGERTPAAQPSHPSTAPQSSSDLVAEESDGGPASAKVEGQTQQLAEDVVAAQGERSMMNGAEVLLHAQQAASHEGCRADVPGSSMAGAAQYLDQIRCLLTNGWNMLQLLYNHSCVVVVAAMMRQTASTVAAFLGDERVSEDLIPLLTTALTAPLRVLRLLFPQAILLHSLLQRPQAKTLRLFVEEGLRHPDDLCLKATLDSMAVVVRSRRLTVEDSMGLVHQSLPFLMDGRLWLREAACGVVEAAARCYPPSVIALHLEYAVRPLLTHPVPLSQLRRFAASIIRSELAAPDASAGHHTARNLYGGLHEDLSGATHEGRAEWSPLNSAVAGFDAFSLSQGSGNGAFLAHHPARESTNGCTASSHVDYRDALPAVVSAAPHATSLSATPALLHTLPTAVLTAPAAEQLSGEEVRESTSDRPVLTYHPSLREAARLEKEQRGTTAPASPVPPTASAPPPAPSTAALVANASRASAFTSLALQGQQSVVAPPHPIDLSPLPTTLPSHSSICRCGIPVSVQRGNGSYGNTSSTFSSPYVPPTSASGTPSLQLSQQAGSPTTAGPTTSSTAVSFTPPSRGGALHPVAAPLSSVSGHMGAVYTAVAAPSASGIVVTAGTRGEAIIWRVSPAATHAAHTRDLTLVERVTAGAPHSESTSFTYVASQWMDVGVQRRDSGNFSVPATANTVALASTDGVLRVLDVERNAWAWSTAVAGGAEGAATGLALMDRRSLLVTTAAGGLHVVDTRCRGSAAEGASVTSTAGRQRSPFTSAWSARLSPLDGAPSCLVPLYTSDRACAAVVATYGGVVCLYDLRYQLCAQRTTVVANHSEAFAPTAAAPSTVSITAACVDPLSSLCGGCRASSWEPAVPGPSLLLGTTSGTVYRLLLQANASGAYRPAFHSSGGVRCMLAQPSNGSVFTGAEDGYIRYWSTDRPETSHTMHCIPYTSPPYSITRNLLGATADLSGSVWAAGGLPYNTKRLATVTQREEGSARGALPPHATDAILTLCAVQTAASSAASSPSAGESSSFLLSGARDGSLTLWDSVE